MKQPTAFSSRLSLALAFFAILLCVSSIDAQSGSPVQSSSIMETWVIAVITILLGIIAILVVRMFRQDRRLKEGHAALSAANKNLFKMNVDLERDRALQRIRAEVASMEKSEDLGHVLGLIFKEARGVGMDMAYVLVMVINEGTDTMHYYLCYPTDGTITKLPIPIMPPIADVDSEVLVFKSKELPITSQPTPMEVWKSQQGDIFGELIDLQDFRRAGKMIWGIEEEDVPPEAHTKSRVVVPFSHGVFGFESHKPNHFIEADLEIGQDFADMMSLGYARFLDFQQLEAQAQEQAKDAALARVRAEVSSMKSQDDWARVMAMMLKEAQNLGLKTDSVNVYVVDETTEHVREYIVLSETFRVHFKEHWGSSVLDRGMFFRESQGLSGGWLVDMWRNQESRIHHFNEAEREQIASWAGPSLGLDTVEPDMVSVSTLRMAFPQGVLAFSSVLHGLYTEDDLLLIDGFAEMVSLGYARFQDFQQLEEKNRALEDANRQVVEATRLKSQFLATMSHELRTPMNAIIGFTRLVLRRGADALPPRQRENLEKVKLSADQLLALINDILDLSKVEAGRVDLKPETFDLKKMIAGCCATVGPTLGKAGVVLDYEVADDVDEVYTDEARLRQVVINLLSNALKFTDEGSVKVHCKVQSANSKMQNENASASEPGEMLEIAVVDTGIGIPEDALGTVFDEFRQVDGSSTRKHAGTGLGLSIVKKLTELMGGTITVESVAGEGSTFAVRIPMRYDGSEQVEPKEAETPEAAQSDASEKGTRTIVSIDDDPNVAVLLREELAEDNYRVVSASNADEGVALVKKLKPSVVTVDIVMPGKDGWETIGMLKADPETRDIPVIVMSVSDNRELGYKLGVQDYLVKPVDRDAMLATLGRLDHGEVNDVLVVDDDRTTVQLFVEMLDMNGFEPRVARNGQEALDAIGEQIPDAILLDLMMPVMDGFEVVDRLQTNPDWRSIPVVVVTAKDLSGEEIRFLNARVSRVVEKGDLDPDVLGMELREILRRAENEG